MAIIAMITGAIGGLLSFLTAIMFFDTTLGQALLLYTGIGTSLAFCLIAAGMVRHRRSGTHSAIENRLAQ